MEFLESADERALLWLNGWVGHFAWLDAVVELVVSDYLVPVLLSLALLGLWFSGANPAARERNQRGVMVGIVGLGLANLVVQITNHYVFRPRPFASIDVSLLFYRPTDSSFRPIRWPWRLPLPLGCGYGTGRQEPCWALSQRFSDCREFMRVCSTHWTSSRARR